MGAQQRDPALGIRICVATAAIVASSLVALVVPACVNLASRLSHRAPSEAATAAEAQLNGRPSEARTTPGSGYHSCDPTSGQPEPDR